MSARLGRASACSRPRRTSVHAAGSKHARSTMCECDVVRWARIVVSVCLVCAIGKAVQLVLGLTAGDEASTIVLDLVSLLCNVLFIVLVPLFITRCAAYVCIIAAAQGNYRERLIALAVAPVHCPSDRCIRWLSLACMSQIQGTPGRKADKVSGNLLVPGVRADVG